MEIIITWCSVNLQVIVDVYSQSYYLELLVKFMCGCPDCSMLTFQEVVKRIGPISA